MTTTAADRTTRKHGSQVSELRPGSEVDATFACSRKDRLTARSGSPYLALELRDRSGSIPARAFRDADFLAGRFTRGDIVRVKGRVERFRDELQIEVESIERADADPAGFLPVAYRDVEELDGFLEHLACEVHEPNLRGLLAAFLEDGDFRAAFRRAPCTRGGHHAYLGGLLEHTVAVTTLALEACTLHPRLNSDVLLTAAVLHDIGKTREFDYGADISLSDEGAMLGHLTLGNGMVVERARAGGGVAREPLLAVCHCILSHHGPDPRFRSAEALALYRINTVDAAVKGALEHGLP